MIRNWNWCTYQYEGLPLKDSIVFLPHSYEIFVIASNLWAYHMHRNNWASTWNIYNTYFGSIISNNMKCLHTYLTLHVCIYVYICHSMWKSGYGIYLVMKGRLGMPAHVHAGQQESTAHAAEVSHLKVMADDHGIITMMSWSGNIKGLSHRVPGEFSSDGRELRFSSGGFRLPMLCSRY